MVSKNVTHVSAFLNTLGGLESVLRHHRDRDSRWHIDSRFLVLFEAESAADDGRVQCLGLNWATSIHDARRRFARHIATRPDETVIYHDLWGLAIFSDLDRAARRIGFIHCPASNVLHCARRNRSLLDGILCVSRPVVEELKRESPGWPPERIQFAPVPVAGLPGALPRTAGSGEPFVLGYSGRLVKADKRVDRLPILCRLLERLEVHFRLEILGSGPLQHSLEQKLRGSPRVVFHGERRGAEYWNILRSWDAIVFVSDLEGMGISLLEAMSAGVLPLYPDISGGAEQQVRQVSPDLLYPPGDLPGLARRVKDLAGRSAGGIQALRRRSSEVVAGHLGDAYHETVAPFLTLITQAPRISQMRFAQRPVYLADLVPLAALYRIYPKGLNRATPTA